MARELQEATWCDWHRLLATPQKIEAAVVRLNPRGKEIDLCDPCAMIWDWLLPRIEQMLEFFDRNVLEALLNTGNPPADEKRDRVPAQLAITDEPAAASTIDSTQAVKGDKNTPTSRGGTTNRGRRITGELQVRCPLHHPGANSPSEYWVKVKDRGSHAASSHKLKPQEIDWVLPADGSLTLPHKCTEHKVCAVYDNGAGFGFPTKNALTTHRSKAAQSGWELANTDATETAAAAA